MVGHFGGGPAVDLGDDAAQHGGGFDFTDRRIIIQPGAKAVDLIWLDIDKEIARRDCG